MAKLTTAEMIEAIKELSVLELNELVKACEEEFACKSLRRRVRRICGSRRCSCGSRRRRGSS